MHITLISGSHRPTGQSHKVAGYLAQQLHAQGHTTSIIKPKELDLPLWDEGIWAGDTAWQTRLQPIKAELSRADGVVVIAPEYAGMVPAALKNFFLFLSPAEVGHKAGLIVTVSASIGGAYPVAELRASSYKNCKLCYVPDHLIVRNVGKVLNPTAADNDAREDPYIRERIDYTLRVFAAYAEALGPIRRSGVTVTDKFGYGM